MGQQKKDLLKGSFLFYTSFIQPSMKSPEIFPIWHMANKSINPVNLFDTDDGNFLVTKDGAWAPILSCASFILVTRELSYFLNSNLDEPLKTKTASIYDRTLNKYINGVSSNLCKT